MESINISRRIVLTITKVAVAIWFLQQVCRWYWGHNIDSSNSLFLRSSYWANTITPSNIQTEWKIDNKRNDNATNKSKDDVIEDSVRNNIIIVDLYDMLDIDFSVDMVSWPFYDTWWNLNSNVGSTISTSQRRIYEIHGTPHCSIYTYGTRWSMVDNYSISITHNVSKIAWQNSSIYGLYVPSVLVSYVNRISRIDDP